MIVFCLKFHCLDDPTDYVNILLNMIYSDECQGDNNDDDDDDDDDDDNDDNDDKKS